MRLLDRPIRRLLGRTTRELALLGIGGGFAVSELVQSGPADLPNFLVYLGATLAFGLRWFAARGLGVGVALSALVLRWSVLRLPSTEWRQHLDWTAYVPFALLALLVSRDLSQRFELAPTRHRWLPNLWATFPAAQARQLRWCAYALGALAGLLVQSWQSAQWWGRGLPLDLGVGQGAVVPAWPIVATVAIGVSILLLTLGRAVVLVVIPAICVPVAVALSGRIAVAETALAHHPRMLASADPLFVHAPHYALPALLLAVVATALALPHAARLLRRSISA